MKLNTLDDYPSMITALAELRLEGERVRWIEKISKLKDWKFKFGKGKEKSWLKMKLL